MLKLKAQLHPGRAIVTTPIRRHTMWREKSAAERSGASYIQGCQIGPDFPNPSCIALQLGVAKTGGEICHNLATLIVSLEWLGGPHMRGTFSPPINAAAGKGKAATLRDGNRQENTDRTTR